MDINTILISATGAVGVLYIVLGLGWRDELRPGWRLNVDRDKPTAAPPV